MLFSYEQRPKKNLHVETVICVMAVKYNFWVKLPKNFFFLICLRGNVAVLVCKEIQQVGLTGTLISEKR